MLFRSGDSTTQKRAPRSYSQQIAPVKKPNMQNYFNMQARRSIAPVQQPLASMAREGVTDGPDKVEQVHSHYRLAEWLAALLCKFDNIEVTKENLGSKRTQAVRLAAGRDALCNDFVVTNHTISATTCCPAMINAISAAEEGVDRDTAKKRLLTADGKVVHDFVSGYVNAQYRGGPMRWVHAAPGWARRMGYYSMGKIGRAHV